MKTLVLVAAALCLAACGKESDLTVAPAAPRDEGQRPPGVEGVVMVHEVCTVTILPDGSVQCVCRVQE